MAKHTNYYHKLFGNSNIIKVRLIEGYNVYYKDQKGIDRVMALQYFTDNYTKDKPKRLLKVGR